MNEVIPILRSKFQLSDANITLRKKKNTLKCGINLFRFFTANMWYLTPLNVYKALVSLMKALGSGIILHGNVTGT